MRYSRFVFLIALILPSTLNGQSVLASSGLGVPLEPLDAIQRALGGVGVTTRAATVLPGNPIAALDVLAPTLAFTTQPHWGKYTIGPERGNFFTTRFPIFGFAYPLGTNGVVTVTAGSHFDQNWSIESQDSVNVGGGSLGVTDTFLSDGGIVTIQAGWARRWSTSFATGVSIGVYRGALARTFTRTFNIVAADTVRLSNPISGSVNVGRWTHSGPLASLNVSWDPNAVFQVGATVGLGGTVKVNPQVGIVAPRREVSVPLEFKVSTIAALTSSLALNAGATVSNWTDLGDPAIEAAGGGRVLSYGGGIEWQPFNFWAGPFPLRMGFRRSDLPFLFLGNTVRESTISFGFSVVMAQALNLPLAAFDVAYESGNRTAGAYQESLRRLTMTMRVGGR